MRLKVILLLSVLLALEMYVGLFVYTLHQESYLHTDSLPLSVSQILWTRIEEAMTNPPCSMKLPLLEKLWNGLAWEVFTSQNYALDAINMTQPKNPIQHDLVAFALTTDITPHYASSISLTWGQRIGQLYIVAQNSSLKLPTIITGLPSDAENVVAGWKFLYERELQHYKWFARMHERNYVFVDTLMKQLSQYSFDMPHYLGFVVSTSNGSYCAPTAGYMLSKKALEMIGPHLHSVHNFAKEEDVMRYLMEKIGISCESLPGVTNGTLLQYIISNPMHHPAILYTQAKQMFELEYFLHGFKPAKQKKKT